MQEHLFELADELKDLRARKDALESELKQVNEDIESADEQLSSYMVDTETQNFTHAGATFYLTTKTHASAQEGKKDELFAALRKEGYGDLICETVNASSLSSFVKEQIEEKTEGYGGPEDLPKWLSGLVNVFEQTKVNMRKAGGQTSAPRIKRRNK